MILAQIDFTWEFITCIFSGNQTGDLAVEKKDNIVVIIRGTRRVKYALKMLLSDELYICISIFVPIVLWA